MRRYLIFAIISLVIFTTGTSIAAPVASSDDAVRHTDATQQEVKLGRRTHEAITEQFTFVADPIRRARVAAIVNRLTPFMERDLDYAYEVVEHEMANAFSIAGGRIYVTTGMLDFVRTDHELAGVIAHEMVHADRKHVILQMARNKRMTLLAIAAMIASKGHGAAIMAANALQVAVMGAYSIDLEKEADGRGIDALARAGYEPVGMLTLQERMMEEAMHRPQIDWGIYQTHPDAKERIAAAERYIIDHGYKLDRKRSLGCLRTKVETNGDVCSLMIDDTVIISADETSETMTALKSAADMIDNDLSLETAPFDVRVEIAGESRSLYIKSRRIISESVLPFGTTIDDVRARVHDALSKARSSHPLAEYFK